MAEKLPMLALSPTMEQGVISQWLKGDAVENGEIICEVETDKAVMDYTSMAEGVLLKILVEEGGEAAVGVPIAIVGEEGEELDPAMLEVSAPPPPAPVAKPAETKDAAVAEDVAGTLTRASPIKLG